MDAIEKLIVVSGQENEDDHNRHIYVFNLTDSKQKQKDKTLEMRQLSLVEDKVQKLVIIVDGKQLISQTTYTVIVWNLEEGSKVNVFHFDQIKEFTIHPKQQKFCILQNKQISMWNSEYSTKQVDFQDHNVICCVFSQSSRYFGSASKSSIKIWDLEKGKQIGNDIKVTDVVSLEFSVDLMSIYSSTKHGFIYQWEIATSKQLKMINNLNDKIISMKALKKDSLLTLQVDNVVKLWTVSQDQYMFIFYDQENINKLEIQTNDFIQNYKISKNYSQNDQFISENQEIQNIAFSSTIKEISYNIGDQIQTLALEDIKKYNIKQSNDNILLKNSTLIPKNQIKKIQYFNSDLYFLENKFLKSQRKSNSNNYGKFKDFFIVENMVIGLKFEKSKLIIQSINSREIYVIINETQKIYTLDYYDGFIYYTKKGTVYQYDVKQNKEIFNKEIHKKKITQLRYINQIKQILTVSEDGEIKLSKKSIDEPIGKLIDECIEQLNEPIYFLEISKNQNLAMIGTRTFFNLYQFEYQSLKKIGEFKYYQNILALQVDFENCLFFVLDSGNLKTGYLSTKRIAQSLSNQIHSRFTAMAYANGIIYIGNTIGEIVYLDEKGEMKGQLWKTGVEEKISKLTISSDQIMISYESKLRIYNLNDKKNFIREDTFQELLTSIQRNIEASFCLGRGLDIVVEDCVIRQVNFVEKQIDSNIVNFGNQQKISNISNNQKISIKNQNVVQSKEINSIHYYYDKKEIIFTYWDGVYSKDQAKKLFTSAELIIGSELIQNYLVIYGKNSGFKIYDMKTQSLKYKFYSCQELICDNIKLDKAEIFGPKNLDLIPIFKEKMKRSNND